MKRRALTLVEVIFSASLLAMVFFLMLSLFPTAMFSIRQTEHRLTAAGIAQAILDECRAGTFKDLVNNASVDLTTNGRLGDILRRSNRIGDDRMEYEPKLTVGNSPTAGGVPRDTLCLVTVEVSWRERGQQLRVTRSLQISGVNR